MKKNKFNSLEKYFFLLITGLNIIPIISGKFFPTLDGPAHLYNSQLINSLLFDSNSLLSTFFNFNKEAVPNWTGHIFLSFFNLFLPAFLAEKIFLLFYMIGLPLSFRILIKNISTNNNLISYLIFPFTYSFIFILGFYNFSIALIFLIITLNYWIKHEENISSMKNIFQLFLLITLTYFSHIFVFGILMFIILLHISTRAIIRIIDKSNLLKEIVIESFRKLGVLLLSSFIHLLLFSYYFYSHSNSENNIFLNYTELTDWLKKIRPIIAYNTIVEEVYTKKIFYAILSISVIAIYNRVNEIQLKKRITFRNIIRVSDVWLFSSICILILYFKLPDSDGSAGFVSVRLGLLFFLILIIWLSTQYYRKWYSLLIVGFVLYCNFKLNIYYTSVTNELNKVAIECNNASEYILPNSIILPLNYSDNWLYPHFSNYIGVDKPMVILENYEGTTGYFPLKWNDKSIPNTLIGDKGIIDLTGCIQWRSNANNQSIKIDYVFVFGNIDLKTDSCNQEIKQIILENYTLTYYSNNCKLYQLKNE